MFITNMWSKKITLWGGGVMVKNLTPQCENEEFKFHTSNLSYVGYISDLIK
jgi:hypothetical protein